MFVKQLKIHDQNPGYLTKIRFLPPFFCFMLNKSLANLACSAVKLNFLKSNQIKTYGYEKNTLHFAFNSFHFRLSKK